LWTMIDSGADDQTAFVTLRHVSPDGDQGYPGALTVTATYSLDEANVLSIRYHATTDRPTIVNITNHAYWALAGEGGGRDALANVLDMPADTYLPVDATLIPTGEFRSVTGSVFDFRAPAMIGARLGAAADAQIVRGRGYDHTWVFGRTPRSSTRLMARVTEPVSGRGFELWSNQSGLQFYSGNFLDGTTVGKTGQPHHRRGAFCLEPQAFPDTVNQPAFGSIRLAPGQEYLNLIAYKFTTAG